MRFATIAVLIIVGIATTVSAQESHPFSVHDMLAMERITDPQISPDGAHIVFVVRTTDLEANRGRTDLWRVAPDGSGLRRLTTHEAGDSNPRWSVDGRTILFLSSRSGSSQVWRIPIDGGEARQVTNEPLDVSSLAVSPDGKRIAYSMDVFADCDTPQCSRDRLDAAEKSKSSGRIYDRLFIRHWDTWKDGRRSHVFVRAIEGSDPAVDVMRGMDADCPTKPFGGPEDYTFTPDGKAIVFSARDAGREEPWSTDFDLWWSPIDGLAPRRCLTKANEAWDASPVFSPDGRTLAYLAMSRPGYESDRFRIVLRAWPEGESRVLTEAWDRSPGSIAWSSDGRSLWVNAANEGQRSLFSVNVKNGNVSTVIEQGTVRSFGEAAGRLIYSADRLDNPTEIYSVRPDGTEVKRVTHINDARVAAARMGAYEPFTFAGWNGETVHGYVVKPADFVSGRRYPVAFLIHGGPQASLGNDFHYRWNPQAYAGAGYGAVMVDFHGSVGYGQAFTDSINQDWGGKPLEDLQKGLAAALEKYDWLDGDRVCALGASYGGFMINWIQGNWPDRFRCLVNHDGNIDERMAYYDTDELWFPEWDHGGTPWDNPEGYSKHNPINYVANWKTPMLVIQGGRDYRVVDTQGMSTFTALQRRGIPSKFLYFPDENHWVLSPANSILWHDTVIDWIDQWTKK